MHLRINPQQLERGFLLPSDSGSCFRDRAELRRQNFYDDIATERDFADDEDARHSTAQVLGDLIAVAERALKALGQISHRFLIQVSSALG